MTDVTEMTEADEAEAEYNQGVEEGYAHAVEVWEPDSERNEFDCSDGRGQKALDSAREGLACLLYRQTSQILVQYIHEHHSDFGLDANYLRGFTVGMRRALDERNANVWLTSLPGYH
jgi:hypothetical protein